MRKESLDYGLEPSVIRALFEYGKKRKTEVGEKNVYDFSLGNPSIPCPRILTDTLARLITTLPPESLHGYTSGPGEVETRNAIADYLNYAYSAKTSGSLIYMTCGAAASLTIAINALVEKEEEVIVFAPFFAEYRVFIQFAGAKVVAVKPHFSTFEPDLEDFLKKITPKTRMVIINSPNNPSGVLYSEETIKKLAEILKRKQEEFGHPIYLLSDEPYRELIYDRIKYPFLTNYYENTLVGYSFSKSLSLPGERIGYLLVNPKCEEAEKVFAAICGAGRALGFVCAPALFQKAIPSCLGLTSDINLYKRNRDFLYNSLIEMGYEAVYPAGAFYLLLKCLEEDSLAFSEKAKSLDLLLVPCDPFGVKGYVRIAYCVEFDTIKRSLPAFKALKKLYEGGE